MAFLPHWSQQQWPDHLYCCVLRSVTKYCQLATISDSSQLPQLSQLWGHCMSPLSPSTRDAPAVTRWASRSSCWSFSPKGHFSKKICLFSSNTKMPLMQILIKLLLSSKTYLVLKRSDSFASSCLKLIKWVVLSSSVVSFDIHTGFQYLIFFLGFSQLSSIIYYY